jgi:hypothetical protein
VCGSTLKKFLGLFALLQNPKTKWIAWSRYTLTKNEIMTILQQFPKAYQDVSPRFHDVGLDKNHVAKICLTIDPNCIDVIPLRDKRLVAAFALRLGVLPHATNLYSGQIYETVYEIGMVKMKAIMKATSGVNDVFRYVFKFISDEEMAGCNLVRLKYSTQISGAICLETLPS